MTTTTAAAQKTPAMIRVSHLSKSFVLADKGQGVVSLWQALRAGEQVATIREVQALRDVSFEVHEGERVGVIGRNGAGKTTLLSILAGISDPTAGEVEISGQVHAMLTIGAVLREETTGRENIWLDGAMHSKSHEEIEARVTDIIAFAELGEFIDRPVRTYSSGMKGRLAFAMGAFVEPDILIIDETLSVGDAFFATKATRRMKEIAQQGRIVFIVSHGLDSIIDMCDRCLWMDHGQIVMDGLPKTVTDAYLAAVRQADETELAAKFEQGEPLASRPDAGTIASVVLKQEGTAIAATAAAFRPLMVEVSGTVSSGGGDLDLRLTRVDGRPIWWQRLSDANPGLVLRGPFTVTIAFDPLLLGADLYGLDCTLVNAGGAIADRRRVFEVVDEHGQFGGKPLLYLPPTITVQALETKSRVWR